MESLIADVYLYQMKDSEKYAKEDIIIPEHKE